MLDAKVQSPSQKPKATMNSSGCCGNSAMITTAATAPVIVPKIRHTPLDTMPPRDGLATIMTVTAAEAGEDSCSHIAP